MTDPLERFEQADAVFSEALDRPVAERAGFLDRACAGDAELREQVERLLRAADTEGPGLPPVDDLAAPAWRQLMAGDDDELAPGTRLGPYEIVSQIGEGGMGRVFRAADTRLRREVALKVLDDRGRSGSLLDRFGREARAASALNHGNIVTIYDVGEEGPLSYIAMEYVEGESLRDRLARGPLALDEAIAIAEQVGTGLAVAHARGIVHRDLKPANVMLTADGVPKIVDFGLAKIEPTTGRGEQTQSALDPLTAEGAIFGTVGYMSPEQATGRALDHRSDLFSLGAVLYEMVSGRRAFAAQSDAEVLAAILKDAPTPLAECSPEAPAALVAAIESCLQKRPEDRYAATDALVRDLRRVRTERLPAGATAVACGDCGVENPRFHRFCSRCGSELKLPCERCGVSIAANLRRCEKCADSVTEPSGATTSGSTAMAGERRQLTVLVTRLCGFDALVENALPEEIEAVGSALASRGAAVVERLGGKVERTGGDELVALFGVPIANEDDARRAVSAALELHEKFAGDDSSLPAVELCSAIHTGPMVVQEGGVSRGYRAVGAAAGVAMSLVRAAEPGQIWLSPESGRLAGSSIATEPQAPVLLSAGAEPVVPLRVISARDSSMPPLESSDAPLTVFAGRQGELGTLTGCVEAALAGEGQFATVIGEAGTGKSRLFFELRRQLGPTDLTLIEGRCQSHGERAPYSPLIHATRALLGVRDKDSPAAQLDSVMEQLSAIDSELLTLLPLYLQLLSISSEQHPLPEHLEGKPFRHAMQEALVVLFTLASQRRTLVLLLEDWHWVDEASHDVVRQLAEMCAGYPLFIAVTHRPLESLDWGTPSQLRTIQLTSLGPVSAAAIMGSVLGADRVDDSLARFVHERTGGNPFFLEEVCRTLREEGAVEVEGGEARVVGTLSHLQLPESVQAVIRTRLDRIEPAARDVLRRASVLGREFALPLLEKLVDDKGGLGASLALLKSRGLVRQARVLPEPVFRFQHALTQEVAYDSLLQRQRKELHGRAGHAIEQDRVDDDFDVLARHFAEAELWEKAVRYGQLFARRARNLSQFTDALTTLEHTREWLERLPGGDATREHWIALLHEESRVCEIVGDRYRQRRVLDELLELLGDSGNRPERVHAYLLRAELAALDREFDASSAALDSALAVSRGLNDPSLERDVLRSMAFSYWQQGRNEEALVPLDRALAIDRELGDEGRIVGNLTNRASVLRGAGRVEEALATILEALEYAESPDLNPHRRVETLYVAYTVYRDLGRTAEGEVQLRRAMEIQSADRFTIHQPFHTSALANILLERGEIDEAVELLRGAVENSRKSRYAFGLSQCQQNLAQVLLGLDRDEEALPHLLEAAKVFQQLRDSASEARMRVAAAPILEAGGSWDEARRCWLRVAELQPSGAPAVAAFRGLARIAAAGGKPGSARDYLAKGLAALRPDDEAGRGEVLNEIGIVEWKREQFEEALEHYRAALEIFERRDDPARAGLLLNSMGACLLPLGRLDETESVLRRALGLHAQAGQPLLQGHAMALLGDVALRSERFEEAVGHYRGSLELRTRLGDRRGEGWMRVKLAHAFAAAGNGDRAAENASLAASIAAELGDNELVEAARGLQAG